MQQSTTRPREAQKFQGNLTREQQKRIINKDDRTDGGDIETEETLEDAASRFPKSGPGDAYNMSNGDRSIQRGANDRGDHDKSRG